MKSWIHEAEPPSCFGLVWIVTVYGSVWFNVQYFEVERCIWNHFEQHLWEREIIWCVFSVVWEYSSLRNYGLAHFLWMISLILAPSCSLGSLNVIFGHFPIRQGLRTSYLWTCLNWIPALLETIGLQARLHSDSIGNQLHTGWHIKHGSENVAIICFCIIMEEKLCCFWTRLYLRHNVFLLLWLLFYFLLYVCVSGSSCPGLQ